MPTALPPFMRGRDVYAFTFTGVTEADDGTLTDATGAGIQTVLLKWEEFDWDSTPITSEQSASDMPTQHDMIDQDRNEFSVQVKTQRNKGANEGANAKGNPLIALIFAYDVIKVSFSWGGTSGSPVNVWNFTGRRGPFNFAGRKSGPTQRLRLSQVNLGPGVANPAMSTGPV